MASSTKWRLNVTVPAQGGLTTNIAEFGLYTNGTNLCTGGTPTADSVASSQVAALAFDGNVNTYWQSAASALPHWLQYEFASAVTDPTAYRITIPTAASTPTPTFPTRSAPGTFTLQYWDGTTWTTYDTQSGLSSGIWAINPLQIFATAATAIVISSLPYSVTHTFAQYDRVWWSYTADVDDVLGFFVADNPATGTFPVSVFSPDAVTSFLPTSGHTLGGASPIQFPVAAGVTYYLRASNTTTASPTTRSGNVSLLRNPNAIAPSGSLWVNDDATGFPTAILSATSGAVLRFLQPVVAGEYADVLPDGRFLVNRGGTVLPNLYLYSSQGALIGAVDYSDPLSNDNLLPIRSNKATAFYIGNPSDPNHSHLTTVRRLDADTLTFGGTTWTVTTVSLGALAPALDETILYYASNGANQPIKRWDLVNNVALSDLAPGIASSNLRNDILVLNDGTILAAYLNTFTGVKHYATDGTVLNSYTMTANADIQIAYALDDPASFWAWGKNVPSGGVSRFSNIRVSDGAVLTTFDATEFEDGVYAPTSRPSDPTAYARFGHSFSCHFFVTRATLGIPPITGTIDVALGAGTDPALALRVSLSGIVSPPKAGDCWRR